MERVFQKLPRYEPSHDLTARVMKRIGDYQVTSAYRRLVFTILPLGLGASALVGYRWYTFFSVRDYSGIATNLLKHLGHLSEVVTMRYWTETFWLIRLSVPMVETTLLMITVAMVAIFAWKLLRLPRLPQWGLQNRKD